MIRVSVVVPTYLRPDLLERCLAALVNQRTAYDQYEVVIADDAASADTRALVSWWSELSRPKIRYVPVTSTRGPAGARNAGWRASRGDIIAFTDDDCVPEPSWLDKGLQAMAEGADAVSGRIIVPLPPRPTDYELDTARLAGADFVTANCFCRRSALEHIDGFDEAFQAAWREDSDLQFTLLKEGYTVADAPDAVVVHPVRRGSWGISLRQQKKTVYDALLRRKHPDHFRKHVAPFPKDYYAIGMALAAGLAASASGHRRLSLAAAFTWTALTARFCTRRLHGTSKSPTHIAEMMVTSALIPPVSLYWHLRGLLRYNILFF